MRHQRRHIQPGFAVDGAAVVLHRHHAGACLGKQLAGHAPHIAKTLHRHPRGADVHANALGRLGAHGEHPTAGGFAPAQRAAQVHRFAGDHAGGGGAFVHRIGVHHPGHDLFVGVHIGRRDVLGRADDDADLTGVTARHPLEFTARELARIDPDAAFGAAVRHVDRSVFDRHPGRQRHHLRQRHVLVKAHTPFAGAPAGVVLHPVALKVGGGAVVQQDRHVHDQGALGALQGFHPARQAAQVRRDAVDLLQVNAPRPEVLGIEVRGQGVGEGGRACGGSQRLGGAHVSLSEKLVAPGWVSDGRELTQSFQRRPRPG